MEVNWKTIKQKQNYGPTALLTVSSNLVCIIEGRVIKKRCNIKIK